MYKNIILSIVTVLLLLSACDISDSDDYQEYVVLEAYAIAHRPLPDVWLSTTLPANEEYQFSSGALEGANIEIALLDENGEEEEIFSYTASGRAGEYSPENSSHFVLPGRTYQLDIDFDNRPETLQVTTTVPDDLQVTGMTADTVVYQSSERLEISVSTNADTWDNTLFVFDAIAHEREMENLTPYYRDLVDEDETDIEELYHNASGLIDVANFDQHSGGSLIVRYPWSGVAFYGQNSIAVNTIDTNLAELAQSQAIQLNGGFTISPGEIPNLRYNVEGGIGIFGSLASDTVQTFFKRPDGI